MLKKTVTYTDYNGNVQTEDFYFNLTKVEILELEYGFDEKNTFTEAIQSLISSNDMNSAISIVKKILLTSYGVKTLDGKRFVKNDEVRTEFEQNPAFEQLYWDLVTDADTLADFISGIIPSSIREELGANPKAELLLKMKNLEETKKG